MQIKLTVFIAGALLVLSTKNLSGQCTIKGPSGPVCASDPVSFSVTNPANATYQWDLDGDGQWDAVGTAVSFDYPGSAGEKVYEVRLFKDSVECQTANVTIRPTPDAAIGVQGTGGAVMEDNVVRLCTGVPSVNISFFNNSQTNAINQSYRIDWGDGRGPQSYNNSTFNNATLITRTYEGYGFHPIKVTTEGNNGCDNTEEYQVYLGSNPSVGLGNPGNTVGLCAPVTLTFPITGTENNPAGTEYNIYINGERVASYTQETVPPFYTHTFNETSCGETTSTGNYQNAFDLQIIASNPCGSSTATVEPIEVSEPPEPLFIIADSMTCAGNSVVFQNASDINEVISGNPSRCESQIAASWAITPGTAGVDWIILDGNLFSSNRVEVDFQKPGTYTVTITINSPSCGGTLSYSEDITVGEPPRQVGATASLDTEAGCAPGEIRFFNRSQGARLTYQWQVSPGSGWSFAGGTDAKSADPVIAVTEGGEYLFRMKASNSCATIEWDTTLTFLGPPAVTLASPSDACQSAVLNFDQNLVAYDDRGNAITQYYWEFPGAEENTSWEAFPQGIRYTSTGNYAYRVAVTNACGTTEAFDTLRVVDPAPVKMPNVSKVCISSSIITLSPNPRGGIWSGPGVSADGKFRPAAAGVGTHTLAYRFGVGQCASDGTMKIQVLPPPDADAGPNLTACTSGDPVRLPGTPAGGTWSATGDDNIVENGQFFPARSGEGDYTLYYKVRDAQGCSATDSLTMRVQAPPEVKVQDLVFCEGDAAVTLPEGEPTGGVWEGPGVSGGNTFNPQAAGGPGNYRLTYRYTAPNGCSATAQAQVEVVGAGAVKAGPDRTICFSDAPIDLAGSASPAGGRWRSSGGGLSGSIFDPSKVQPGQITLTYEVGVGNCTLKDQLKIEVVATPAIDFGSIPTFICDNDGEVELAVEPAGGRWRVKAGQAVLNGNRFDVSASGPGEYIFEYTFSSGGNCTVQDEITIKVGSPPEIQVGDTVYCNGPGRVGLPLAEPAGGRWSGRGVDKQFFYPERAGGVGNYSLKYTYANGGCIVEALADVEVVDPVIVEAGPGDTVCMADGVFELQGYSPDGGRWSGPGISDPRLGLLDPEEAGEGIHSLVYTIGNSGCVTRDTVQVQVVAPLAVVAGPALNFCPEDNPVALTGASPDGGQWSGTGVVGNRFDPGVAGTGKFAVEYAVRDRTTGCITRAKRDVVVHPSPVSLFPAPPAACVDDTIQFHNESRGAFTARWDFGDGQNSAEGSPKHVFASRGAYTVTLISTNDYGCADTLAREIQVAQPPAAEFAIDLDEGCAPLTVSFDDRSTGDALAYEWDFGNGRVSTASQPEAVTFVQGRVDTTYVVTLTLKNQCATERYSDTITVFPQPVVDFGTAVDTSCSPLTAVFGNRTTGLPDFYLWDFGNGNTSQDSLPPTQTYVTDTTVSVYTIRLIAGNQCGQDTVERQVVVKPVDVNAFFNVPTREGCQPFTVPFTNYSTVGASVTWDFGDGNRSSGPNPVHTFTEAGEYDVWQYATNGCGMDSVHQTIRVLPGPATSFEVSQYGCVGAAVTFNNTSEPMVEYKWRFGDGDSSLLLSPQHTFREPGTYRVVLTGTAPGYGCPGRAEKEITVFGNPSVSFDASLRDGCAPLPVDFNTPLPEGYYYEWDFGDGNTSTEPRPRHIFTSGGAYDVRLTVTDVNGCSQDTSLLNIQVHPEPVADFTLESEVLCGLPATLRVRNESVGATGFAWNFGDGATSTFNQPDRHVYADSGRYDITLIASSPFNCRDTVTRAVDVFPPPLARYEISDQRGCSPLEVTFINYSAANHYLWNFGDGKGSSLANPTHTYLQPGEYDVQLIVSYNQVCFDTLELHGQVTVFPSPVADFEMLEDRNGPPGSIEMINRSLNASAWYWEFGDGATSLEEHPNHRYLTNGPRQVYLEATNVYGCTDDTVRTIHPPLLKGLFIPNAFSPETGTGEVRLFKPKGAGLKEYRVQVFSPYGQLVWESSLLNEGQPAEAWDGTMNGQLLPQDVYVWKAYGIFEDGTNWRGMPDASGNPRVVGSVTLLR